MRAQSGWLLGLVTLPSALRQRFRVRGEKSGISAKKAAESRAGFTFLSFRATTAQGLYF